MKTLIIDGNNLIHRTYWTAKTQSKRTNTDTPEQISNFHIFFTINAIHSYVTKYTPEQTICVWDEKPDYQQNDRKTQFEGYKGNRSKDSTPHQNNEAIKKILKDLGIRSMFPRELEADDIVAFLCENLTGNKIIVSVDKDFLQLINPNTILYDPIRKEEYTVENFKEKTGWDNTFNWLNAKCVQGDKSDNVPGIPGFGVAKIKKWLKNEIELTEEQFSVFKRNLSLFSLDAFHYKPEEQGYYEMQLKKELAPDWKGFLRECEERQFNSFLKKKEAWYTLFFIKNKLQSIFS